MNKIPSPKIPSYVVFGLLMGLVQCSDCSTRSALFEPDLGNGGDSSICSAPSVAQAAPLPSPQGGATASTTPAAPRAGSSDNDDEDIEDSNDGRPGTGSNSSSSSASGSDDEDIVETPIVPTKPPAPRDPKKTPGRGDNGGTSVSTDSGSTMSLSIEDSQSFVRTLFPKALGHKLVLEDVRLDLKTLRYDLEKDQTRLSGDLIFKAKGYPELRLFHENDVLFMRAGDAMDIAQGQFRVARGLFVEVNLTRTHSDTPEAARANAWEGTISFIQGSKRTELGRIHGFVTTPAENGN